MATDFFKGLRSYLRYDWGIVRRAFIETWAFATKDRKHKISVLAVFSVGTVTHLVIYGADATIQELSWAVSGTVAVILIGIVVFFYKLANVPYKAFKELKHENCILKEAQAQKLTDQQGIWIPIHEEIERVKKAIGLHGNNDADYNFIDDNAEKELRQHAFDGEVTIRGREETNPDSPGNSCSDVYKDIPKEYWETMTFSLGSILDENARDKAQTQPDDQHHGQVVAKLKPRFYHLEVWRNLVSVTKQDPKRLKQLYEDGQRLLERGKSPPGEWRQKITTWFKDSEVAVEKYANSESWEYNTYSRYPKNDEIFDKCSALLEKRLVKLRAIISRMQE